MEVKIGNYKLVHSGIVIQIENLPITVKLPDEVEGDYTFVFKFTNDTNEKGMITSFNALDSHTLEIELKNFDHAQNGGNNEIVDVGTLKGIPLFLSYRAFDLPTRGKTFIFNFYVKEVQNG